MNHLNKGEKMSLATSGNDSGATPSLEKIPVAARRMGVSVSQFYRIAKRDGLRIIKVTDRASAVPQSDVDGWINERISRHVTTGKAVVS